MKENGYLKDKEVEGREIFKPSKREVKVCGLDSSGFR